MHYFTQILSIILICFLSPLLPPHMFLSLWTFLFTFSLSPSRVFCVKKKRRKKGFSWKAEVIFCLSASCLPAVQICCYFVPKGQNKSLWWKSKTIGAGQSHKVLVTQVEPGESPASWESLSEAQAHINTWWATARDCWRKGLVRFVSLPQGPSSKERMGEGLPFPWFWCLSSSWLSLWPPGISNKKLVSFLMNNSSLITCLEFHRKPV